MLRAAPTLAAALALAAAAAPSPARAFGEPARQVLIEATLLVVERHDGILSELEPLRSGQRLDPALEASLAAATAQAADAAGDALDLIEADPLADAQDGAAALVLLSIAAGETDALAALLAEEGEPKAGKVAKPARLARSLAVAAVTSLQGRPGRLPLGRGLDREASDYWGEVRDLFPFLLAHGLPADPGALVEPMSGGPKGRLLERASLLPGPGMRAKPKKDELELSADGQGPVSAGLDLNVPLGPGYTALVTLKLPPRLRTRQREALAGVSAGFKVTTDASADPAEAFFVEHQLSPDGWVQSFVASKTQVLETFPHASADPLREITSFVVKDGSTLTLGALLRDGSGETKIERSGIPVLGDVPVLGLFFRNNDKAKLVADDLIVFTTPHLVGDGGTR
jgi:hypothetical protein